MAEIIKNSGFRYLKSDPRNSSRKPIVGITGWWPRGRPETHRWYPRTSIGFLFSGKAEFVLNENKFAGDAPLMFFIPPASHCTIRSNPSTYYTWRSLYFSFELSDKKLYQRWGLTAKSSFLTDLSGLENFDQYWEIYAQILDAMKITGFAEKMDRLAELMVLEAFFQKPVLQDKLTRNLYSIENYMRKHLNASLDFKNLAREHGISFSHFFRLWKKEFGVSPGRYFLQLKLSEACHLLETSHESIKQIANQVGFEDQLHFSRRFHKHFGLPPSQYRLSGKRHSPA